MSVQGGEQHHRPLHDEARRRLERVRVAMRAELDAAVAAGDDNAAHRAARQLQAVERALAAHDGGRRRDRPVDA